MAALPNIYFPSKNACIYCGKFNILLTDEHIVPLSLGGKHIIKKASCVMCANITKKFEQDVARKLWGDARTSYNFPTRRKKERPNSIILKNFKSLGNNLSVPAEEYPALLLFYIMPAAGILSGTDPKFDSYPQWKFVGISDDDRRKKFESKYNGRVTASFTNEPKSFARMLAKIGHGYVMTALDLDDFTPICLPYILGKRSNISYVVGGGPTNDPMLPELGYFLRTIQLSSNDRTLIVVEVRLIANNDTPTYHVVVGEVIGRENMERVNEKLSAIYPSEKGINFELTNAPNGYHWMPKIWPVEL